AVISIRPNPNSGNFSLELSENMDNAELSVRNIRGQQIYYKQFNRLLLKGESILLNIDFPDKGIYFVIFKSNKKQFISKLMVR
ncbi:MAG: T9SS type A sorting domain-containing protein, partial [Chlorobi bacterium]|nr:T9SS type A sorting domain-containing protein [Chlorobiota bacterium]